MRQPAKLKKEVSAALENKTAGWLAGFSLYLFRCPLSFLNRNLVPNSANLVLLKIYIRGNDDDDHLVCV